MLGTEKKGELLKVGELVVDETTADKLVGDCSLVVGELENEIPTELLPVGPEIEVSLPGVAYGAEELVIKTVLLIYVLLGTVCTGKVLEFNRVKVAELL